MGLRLVYLTVSRMFGWLRLWRRPESWKSAEILLLPHQLTVLQRQVEARPKMSWADRACIALLLDIIPKQRGGALRLIVTPQTVLRWHRLRQVLREYEAHHNQHRPHRSLGQAAPLKSRPPAVTDLDSFRLRRHTRVSGVNEYTLAA